MQYTLHVSKDEKKRFPGFGLLGSAVKQLDTPSPQREGLTIKEQHLGRAGPNSTLQTSQAAQPHDGQQRQLARAKNEVVFGAM